MLHPVKIGDNIYSVKGGKVLINGEVKDIKGGKVLIGGVVKDIKFGTPISDFTEGTLVYMNESGSPVQFYVAKHDYESELNGTGRTLFVRKAVDVHHYPWTVNSLGNGYENCSMDKWFTGTYLSTLDADIQTLIGTTKIPCVRDKSSPASYTLERSVFALSCTEYSFGTQYSASGGTIGTVADEGTPLPIYSTLRNDTQYLEIWTRSLVMENPGSKAWSLRGNTISINAFTNYHFYRPAFTLPSDTLIDDDYNIIT